MISLFTTHKPILTECPIGLRKNLESWKQKNPTLGFLYYSESEMNDWMMQYTSSNTSSAFKLLNTGAGRADLFRICKMNIDGGIWFDADLPSFDILSANARFIDVIEERHTVFIKNTSHCNPRYMVMASKPNSKILALLESKIVELITKHSSEKSSIKTISVTGPFVLHSLLCDLLNLSDISQLETDKDYGMGFVYINDIVPSNSPVHYDGYRSELKKLNICHHTAVNAINGTPH